jgi:hypothetical protein
MNRLAEIFAKIGLVLFMTLVFMISGAMVVYWIVGTIYIAVCSGEHIDPMRANEVCARGMVVGYLSIFGGALLGAILGCVGSLKQIASSDAERGD